MAHLDTFKVHTLKMMSYMKNTRREWILRDNSNGDIGDKDEEGDEGEESHEGDMVPPFSSTHGETFVLNIDWQH